jgi:hypothetical protein
VALMVTSQATRWELASRCNVVHPEAVEIVTYQICRHMVTSRNGRWRVGDPTPLLATADNLPPLLGHGWRLLKHGGRCLPFTVWARGTHIFHRSLAPTMGYFRHQWPEAPTSSSLVSLM